jgi:hypothetical protein
MKKLQYVFALICISASLFMVMNTQAQNEPYLGAASPNGKVAFAEKPTQDFSYKYETPSGREGGEDIASAIVIPSLPFTDNGFTCDNINDYDEVCPYSGSFSPDVVYSYTPNVNGTINIDLNGSNYDTKVFVYQNGHTPGYPYACNDDYYSNYVSAIWGMNVTVGNTYFIVIDGYYGDCGDYTLSITPVAYCGDCLPCSFPEGEGDIPYGGIDHFNGGCNSNPHVFSSIALNTVICARTNTYIGSEGGGFRDTDWYEITLTEAGTLYYSVFSSFTLYMYILNNDCSSIVSYTGGLSTGNCEPYTVSAYLPAGTYYLWAGYSDFTGLPNGGTYQLIATLDAPPPADWCTIEPPSEVPVSNWALYLAIGLIGMFVAFRFWRKI